jgi:hypothetical protein
VKYWYHDYPGVEIEWIKNSTPSSAIDSADLPLDDDDPVAAPPAEEEPVAPPPSSPPPDPVAPPPSSPPPVDEEPVPNPPVEETPVPNPPSIGPTLPGGQLIKGDASDAIYMMQGGYKHHIYTAETYDACGYSWSAYAIYPQADVDAIPTGPLWTLGNCLPNGSLIKSNNAASIYMMENGYKRGIFNPDTFVSCGYSWSDYVTYMQEETVNVIPAGPLWTLGNCLPNGSLIKGDASVSFYILENGYKHLITSLICNIVWRPIGTHEQASVDAIPEGGNYPCNNIIPLPSVTAD